MRVSLADRGDDGELAEALRRDKDLQRQMCDPTFNPDAASFFIFNYCLTQDEERAGSVCSLPNPRERGRWCLGFVDALDAPRLDPHNVLDEKCRRKLHTWLACFYNLWSLLWVKGYTSLLISASQDHVDDGGRTQEKTFSMFSRMRFAYDRLPYYVTKPVAWSFMSGSCGENESYTIGRAPTREAGRGGGFGRILIDESEFVEYLESIHAAADPACRYGKVYMGTVNGEATLPAKLAKQIRRGELQGWKLFECDWWDDPACCEGLRETTPGPERERYGLKVSPWFVAATASLDSETIAAEYLRDRRRSSKATCFYEYNKQVHVVTRPARVSYDRNFEVRVGLDFGKARKTAAVIAQPVLDRMRVLGAFEGTGKTAPTIAKELAARVLGLCPGIRLDDVVLIPDPSGLIGEQGTDVPLLDYYLNAGFGRYVLPPITGPGSVRIGIQICNVAFMRRLVEIDEVEGAILVEALPLYRWPIDRITREVKRDADPIHGMESHVCDAFRYDAVSIFPSEHEAVGIIDYDEYDRSGRPPDERRVQSDVGARDDDAGIFDTITGRMPRTF